MAENSFDWSLDSIFNTGIQLGTKYYDMKTAEEVRKNNEALVLAENANSDKLYNAIANIPSNMPVDNSFNLVNSWNGLADTYKMLALAGVGAGLFFLIRK